MLIVYDLLFGLFFSILVDEDVGLDLEELGFDVCVLFELVLEVIGL